MTHWIRTPEELEALAGELRGARQLALDSESDSLHHYTEKVCLVQIADDRGRGWLVDTLAVRDLAPLAPLLADPRLPKVLHGADYDVSTLKELVRRWKPEAMKGLVKEGKHEALADILESIEELKFYRRAVMTI